MILLANIMSGVALVLNSVIGMMIFLVIAHAVLSWVSPDPYNPIVRFINSMVEPFYYPLRRRIPPIGPGIDLSPLIFLFTLYFIREALVKTLADYAGQIKARALLQATLESGLHQFFFLS